MSTKFLTVLSLLVVSNLAQRPSYLRRPVGYPVLESPSTESGNIDNRFSNDKTTTTERLPIEALGDRDLFETLSRLPQNSQPFWLLNWKALEEYRKQPHTYQQRRNNFIDSSSFVGFPI